MGTYVLYVVWYVLVCSQRLKNHKMILPTYVYIYIWEEVSVYDSSHFVKCIRNFIPLPN